MQERYTEVVFANPTAQFYKRIIHGHKPQTIEKHVSNLFTTRDFAEQEQAMIDKINRSHFSCLRTISYLKEQYNEICSKLDEKLREVQMLEHRLKQVAPVGMT